MRQMIHRLDPAVARLPTTRGGPAAPMTPATVHRFVPFYGQMARKAVDKSVHLVTGRRPFAPRAEFAWPVEETNAAVVRHLRATGVVDPADLRIAPLLSREAPERLGLLAMSDRMLGRLVTAELALARTGTSL